MNKLDKKLASARLNELEELMDVWNESGGKPRDMLRYASERYNALSVEVRDVHGVEFLMDEDAYLRRVRNITNRIRMSERSFTRYLPIPVMVSTLFAIILYILLTSAGMK